MPAGKTAIQGICTFIQLLLVTGCVSTGTGNLYFAGFIKHHRPTPKTNEGDMNYFGLSGDFERDKWNFETGASTFVDSYNKQSYMIFSNVSHDDYRWRYLTPVVSLHCAYKGNSYYDDSMKLICAPPVSLRVGPDKGLFVYITPVPKFGHLTNGFVSALFGYRFKP